MQAKPFPLNKEPYVKKDGNSFSGSHKTIKGGVASWIPIDCGSQLTEDKAIGSKHSQ